MYYFSLQTVTNSFVNLKDSTPNKFWGFLGVLRCIDTDWLKSEITYIITNTNPGYKFWDITRHFFQ